MPPLLEVIGCDEGNKSCLLSFLLSAWVLVNSGNHRKLPRSKKRRRTKTKAPSRTRSCRLRSGKVGGGGVGVTAEVRLAELQNAKVASPETAKTVRLPERIFHCDG